MMKVLLTWLGMIACLVSARADERFERANADFEEGRFEEAAAAYEELLDSERPRLAVLQNLGSAYFRSGDVGRAILAFERALLLKPGDPDLRANLKLVRDEAAVFPPPPAEGWRGWLERPSRKFWSGLALGSALLLPVAAGLGGGSSDAGATLRLLRSALDLAVQDEMLTAIAGRLGADGPVCLWGRAAMTSGRGDRLAPPPGLPPLNAVLVNPGVPSSTAGVYRAFDQSGRLGDASPPSLPPAFESAEEVAAFMAWCRNDLEAPAVGLERNSAQRKC